MYPLDNWYKLYYHLDNIVLADRVQSLALRMGQLVQRLVWMAGMLVVSWVVGTANGLVVLFE